MPLKWPQTLRKLISNFRRKTSSAKVSALFKRFSFRFFLSFYKIFSRIFHEIFTFKEMNERGGFAAPAFGPKLWRNKRGLRPRPFGRAKRSARPLGGGPLRPPAKPRGVGWCSRAGPPLKNCRGLPLFN